MYLSHLSLTNFRNYARLSLDLNQRITLIKGGNAQGKTNLLEAVNYLATASSPLANADRQLINWLADEDTLPFARVVGQVVKGQHRLQIEITLVKDIQSAGQGETPPIRKTVRINGADKRVSDLIGQLHVVLFLPQDIELVDGSPGTRRRYLNSLLSQVDPRYYRLLRKYGQVIYQRNHLLRRMRNGRPDPEQLAFWDRQVIENGAYLIARRRKLLAQLNRLVAEIHPQLTGQGESLTLIYDSSVDLDGLPSEAEAQRQLSLLHNDLQAELREVGQRFREQLTAIRGEEIKRGHSRLGPHRDDVQFLANGIDMNTYGSRGQQRTVALSLKLAEVEWLHRETGEMPMLLLDDMISELDPDRRRYLIHTLESAQQVLTTTTEVQGLPRSFLIQATTLKVENGQIKPLPPSEIPGRTGA